MANRVFYQADIRVLRAALCAGDIKIVYKSCVTKFRPYKPLRGLNNEYVSFSGVQFKGEGVVSEKEMIRTYMSVNRVWYVLQVAISPLVKIYRLIAGVRFAKVVSFRFSEFWYIIEVRHAHKIPPIAVLYSPPRGVV